MIYEVSTLILLFVVALAAGTIDSIAGGGGMIVTPSLLLAGMPPIIALGTGKFQSTFCTAAAAYNNLSEKVVRLKYPSFFMAIIFFSSMIGTLCISNMNQDFVKILIFIILIIVFIYSIYSKRIMSKIDTKGKITKVGFFSIFSIPFGFYDGFIGSGIAYIWTLAQVFFLGINLKTATGYSKLYNFCGNLGGVIIFIYLGEFNLKVGIIMGIGQLIGGFIGSNIAIKKDVGFIRNVVLISSFCMICVLFDKYYLHLENFIHFKL